MQELSHQSLWLEYRDEGLEQGQRWTEAQALLMLMLLANGPAPGLQRVPVVKRQSRHQMWIDRLQSCMVKPDVLNKVETMHML